MTTKKIVNDKSKKINVSRKSFVWGISFILLSFVTTSNNLYSQASINSAGGSNSSGNGIIHYSIGQVFYNIHSGTGGYVSEGVQQAYEISIVNNIPDNQEHLNISFMLKPNPINDYLILSFEGDCDDELNYKVINLLGETLLSNKLDGFETIIQMSNLAPATYFIEVYSNKNTHKIFKIVKL